MCNLYGRNRNNDDGRRIIVVIIIANEVWARILFRLLERVFDQCYRIWRNDLYHGHVSRCFLSRSDYRKGSTVRCRCNINININIIVITIINSSINIAHKIWTVPITILCGFECISTMVSGEGMWSCGVFKKHPSRILFLITEEYFTRQITICPFVHFCVLSKTSSV